MCSVAILKIFAAAFLAVAVGQMSQRDTSDRPARVYIPTPPGKSSQLCTDFRWRHVVRQQYDYSCGAAALATLIRYYFRDQATEDEILDDILGQLTQEEVAVRKELGLTMLDLKRCAQRRGYQAEGVRIELSRLAELRGPVLVHLGSGRHSHFAVLRGIYDGQAYLADPSQGQIRLPVACFGEEWTGIALVLGKPGFGLPNNHPLSLEPDAP